MVRLLEAKFSFLNSLNSPIDSGIVVNSLPLKPNVLKFVNFPNVSGNFFSLFDVKYNTSNPVNSPIASGSFSSFAAAISSSNNCLAVQLFLKEVSDRPIYSPATLDNIGSIRVLEKAGFSIDAYNNGFADAWGMVIDEVVIKLE